MHVFVGVRFGPRPHVLISVSLSSRGSHKPPLSPPTASGLRQLSIMLVFVAASLGSHSAEV